MVSSLISGVARLPLVNQAFCRDVGGTRLQAFCRDVLWAGPGCGRPLACTACIAQLSILFKARFASLRISLSNNLCAACRLYCLSCHHVVSCLPQSRKDVLLNKSLLPAFLDVVAFSLNLVALFFCEGNTDLFKSTARSYCFIK